MSALSNIVKIYFPVFIIILAVVSADFTQNTAGIADSNDICRDIPCNDASRTDNRVVSYTHARKYDNPAPSQQFLPICTAILNCPAFLRSSGKTG